MSPRDDTPDRDGDATPLTRARRNWRPDFLAALELTGNVRAAAKVAGVDRSTVYRACHAKGRTGDRFRAAWDEAMDAARERFEEELVRRGVTGWDEPVYGTVKRDDGTTSKEVVGTIRRYSDRALELLMKAHWPERYSERYRLEHTGAGGGPIATTDPRQDLADRLVRMAERLDAREANAAAANEAENRKRHPRRGTPMENPQVPDLAGMPAGEVADMLSRFPEVLWDRCTEVKDPYIEEASVFGWIERPDGRFDFVALIWERDAGGRDAVEDVRMITSSAQYSEEFYRRLTGSTVGHVPCRKIEERLGLAIVAKIPTSPRAAQIADEIRGPKAEP